MKNLILFSIPAIIWGSTWLAIKYQLGIVDPLVSVFYRFLLAAIILFAYCRLVGTNLRYSVKQHFLMALQGLLLFGINYWLVYLAEIHLKSGLVAVLFSTIIFLNIFVRATNETNWFIFYFHYFNPIRLTPSLSRRLEFNSAKNSMPNNLLFFFI